MQMSSIPFGTTDWSAIASTEHKGDTGVATWRTQQFGSIRVRMVEYSPGYLADPLSGSTRAGAVVWLQSIVLLVDATDATEPSGAARRISDRLWQRIINPPIR